MKICKRLLPLLLLAALLLAGCGEDSEVSQMQALPQEKSVSSAEPGAVDLDLTALSSTMVYAEVYNMMCTPEQYLGKTVRMSGTYSEFQEPSTGQRYYTCLIADATACCSQGMEFVLTEDYAYPADYPKPDSQITVTGVFETYREGSDLYCHLTRAVLE